MRPGIDDARARRPVLCADGRTGILLGVPPPNRRRSDKALVLSYGRYYRYHLEDLQLDITRVASLDEVGLRDGDLVRFQRVPAGRYTIAKVKGVNADGSIGCVDPTTGHHRSVPVDRLEVKYRGPRGGDSWTPVVPPPLTNQEATP